MSEELDYITKGGAEMELTNKEKAAITIEMIKRKRETAARSSKNEFDLYTITKINHIRRRRK